MKGSRILFFLILTAASLPVLPHARHDHAGGEISLERWRQHLSDFQRYGRAADLSGAKHMLDAPELAEQPLSIEYLLLEAQTLQADHQFDLAASQLKSLLQRKPGHAGARLMLANTLLVSGAVQDARHTCAALFSEVPLLVIQACTLQTYLLDAAALQPRYARLRALLELGPDSLSPSTRAWLHGLLGDAARVLEDAEQALIFYQRAYADQPLARFHSAMVDVLLAQGRNHEALALASSYPDHLGMQVKRLVAAKALGELSLHEELFDTLHTDLRSDIAAGDLTHGREIAEFLLFVEDEPTLAREVVEAYLDVQMEPEDIRLLDMAGRQLD